MPLTRHLPSATGTSDGQIQVHGPCWPSLEAAGGDTCSLVCDEGGTWPVWDCPPLLPHLLFSLLPVSLCTCAI